MEIFVDLMKLVLPKIILMPATLPTINQLPDFYQVIIVVKSFASFEAKIGCALISKTGELYVLHLGCETVDDIKHILEVIKTNHFMEGFTHLKYYY